jgi:archaellum component FlaG (FlaF/FlaG flagellin family)
MNKRQKWTLIRFVLVLLVTLAAVAAIVEMKNGINRAEATRAMEQLGKIVSDYKQKNGYVPPESFVDNLKESLVGQARLGDLHYRARWIDVDSTPDTILAFTKSGSRSLFFKSELIVLLYDGKVVRMDEKSFDKLLASQQKPGEE